MGMAEKPNILIGVPAYRNQIDADCSMGLIALSVALTRAGFQFGATKIDKGDIETARNILASRAMLSFSHVLMIDNDMGFAPSAALKLIRAQRDVIACSCPLRHKHGNLWFSAVPYYADGRLEPDGTMRASQVGTGIILISTNALKKLAATNHIRMESSKEDGAPIYGFFDKITSEDGRRIGEDYSFCDRWTSLCGGEIYAVIDEEISHADNTVLRGKHGDYLNSLAPAHRRAF